jgi:hypothetical protein
MEPDRWGPNPEIEALVHGVRRDAENATPFPRGHRPRPQAERAGGLAPGSAAGHKADDVRCDSRQRGAITAAGKSRPFQNAPSAPKV